MKKKSKAHREEEDKEMSKSPRSLLPIRMNERLIHQISFKETK